MSLARFHPLIRHWFENRFGEPTEPQRRGWPSSAAGRDALITAPTGSGTTLATFLICLDQVYQKWRKDELESEIKIVYVSPLKALSNDIEGNLQTPLHG